MAEETRHVYYCDSDYIYMDINTPILIWLRQYSD